MQQLYDVLSICYHGGEPVPECVYWKNTCPFRLFTAEKDQEVDRKPLCDIVCDKYFLLFRNLVIYQLCIVVSDLNKMSN